MLHFKNTKYGPEHSREIINKARDLTSDLDASVRVARIAREFVEIDVGVEKEDLNILVEKLSPIGTIDNIRHVFEEEIEKEQGITDGIFYFNNERFWESHESFEGVWKQCFGREKEILQGIILFAVMSLFWTPPSLWFLVGFLIMIFLQKKDFSNLLLSSIS